MKILRLNKKIYFIRPFRINQTRHIISSLREFETSKIEDIPNAGKKLIKAISWGISTNPFKRLVVRLKLRKASLDDLIQGGSFLINEIPANEFFVLNSIVSNFKKISTNE